MQPKQRLGLVVRRPQHRHLIHLFASGYQWACGDGSHESYDTDILMLMEQILSYR